MFGYQSSSNQQENQPGSNESIFLDANSGLPADRQALGLFSEIASKINNINGYTNQKLMYQQLINDQIKQLCQLFNFDHLFITNSSTSSIQLLIESIGLDNIKFVDPEHQHPKVRRLIKEKTIPQRSSVVFINLVTSEENINQSYQLQEYKDVPYIIVDCTQAIGRVRLPTKEEASCIFISGKKLGTVSNISYIFCSDMFYQKFFSKYQTSSFPEEHKSKFIAPTLRPQDCFDAALFISSFGLINQYYNLYTDTNVSQLNNNIYKLLSDVLSNIPEISIVNSNNLNNTIKGSSPSGTTSTSLIFQFKEEYKHLCPRSFQKLLDDNNVQIGFSTACESNTSGKLRLSWRGTQEELYKLFNQLQSKRQDLTEVFKQSIEVLSTDNDQNEQFSNSQFTGGAKNKELNNTDPSINLAKFNQQLFFLNNHWVKSHNEPPHIRIPKKYTPYFEYHVLNQKNKFYLYVPELEKEFQTFKKQQHELLLELPNQKQDSNTEEDDLKKQFEYSYRVSKNIYLTPFTDIHEDNEFITLKDFEKQDFPDNFLFLFEGQYLMTKDKYNWCKHNNIELSKEYVNNPMSQYILDKKLSTSDIVEYLINEPNSYSNNIKYVRSSVNKQHLKNLSENRHKIQSSEEDQLKKLHLIQPSKQYQNENAVQLAIELKKKRYNVALIMRNVTLEQQQELLRNGYLEEKNQYYSFNNWYQMWYYDQNISIFTNEK